MLAFLPGGTDGTRFVAFPKTFGLVFTPRRGDNCRSLGISGVFGKGVKLPPTVGDSVYLILYTRCWGCIVQVLQLQFVAG